MAKRSSELRSKILRGFGISAGLKIMGAIAFFVLYVVYTEMIFLAMAIILFVAGVALIVFMQYMLKRIGSKSTAPAAPPNQK